MSLLSHSQANPNNIHVSNMPLIPDLKVHQGFLVVKQSLPYDITTNP